MLIDPADWIIETRCLSPEERGLLVDVLAFAWWGDGLPEDPADLAERCGVSKRRFRRVWQAIEASFNRLWITVCKSRSRYIPAHVRAAVMERDEFACVECGATTDLALDHFFPFALGGVSTEENLRVLCRSCNSRKGARVPAETE